MPSKPLTPKNPPPTHFLCLPLCNTSSLPQLIPSLATFRQRTKALILTTDEDEDGSGYDDAQRKPITARDGPSKEVRGDLSICPRLQEDGRERKEQQYSSGEQVKTESGSSQDKEPRKVCAGNIIQDRMFRPPGALHLTLGVMHLVTQEQITKATNLLEGLRFQNLLPSSHPPFPFASASLSSTLTPIASPASPDNGTSNKQKDISEGNPVNSPKIEAEAETESLTTDLIGLHALPSPINTRVLYTSPSPPLTYPQQ